MEVTTMVNTQKRLKYAKKKCQTRPQSKGAALERLERTGIVDKNGNINPAFRNIIEKNNQNEQ